MMVDRETFVQVAPWLAIAGNALLTPPLQAGVQSAAIFDACLWEELAACEDAEVANAADKLAKYLDLEKVANMSMRGRESGIRRLMSINLLLENPSDPVIWRGPVIAGVVKQFWNEVIWNDVDYMFVDMPPGTGDVPLTVFQSIPVDGVIIVTSPQDLVKMIVGKAVGMAHLMNIPILGIVENMSYVECPDCGKKINLYGESHTAEAAAEYGLKVLGSLPVDPAIAQSCDSGNIEAVEDKWLSEAVKAVEEAPAKPKA